MTIKPDPHLPAARVVPKDRADRVAIARSHAADGAKRAGRAAVAVTKGVSLLAVCGLGLGLLGAGIGARPRSRFDDFDRQIESLRRFQVRPLPKLDFKLDYQELLRRDAELNRWNLRDELERDRALRLLRALEPRPDLANEPRPVPPPPRPNAATSLSPSQRAQITW